MPGKEKVFSGINSANYDIAGNLLRVWRDQDGKIIFIVDETIDEFKPNVLLVMDAVEDRKWDDVLQNDYGIDLETIRPRRDNLYQKLDIEYYGLDEYARLIDAYEQGEDINDILRNVMEFRDAVARRAATVRLTTALDTVNQAQDTLERAEYAVQGMREKRKKLRARLAKQKSFIGQEPTKQSASRILHIESQIESNDEKIARAEKRIENAKHRIAVATDEAEEMRKFLARRRGLTTNINIKQDGGKKMRKQNFDDDTDDQVDYETGDVKINDEEESMNYNHDENQDDHYVGRFRDDEFDAPDYEELTNEPKEQDMADAEEVKPLLDQDPEILDEEIAFKPVKFEDIESGVDGNQEANRDTVVQPLSFSTANNEERDFETHYEEQVQEPESVLDTIRDVHDSVPSDTDTTGAVTNTQYENNNVVRPVVNNTTVSERPGGANRPISPITGGDVRPVDGKTNRPTFAYYALLILLIALSVFALWLYQQKNGGALPELSAPVDVREDDIAQVYGNEQNLLEEPDIPVVIQEPVQYKPINIVYPNDDILRAAEPAPVVVEPEEDVLARKEPYNVSQHENMFVRPDPEPAPAQVPEPVVRETNVMSPDVIFDDNVITVPMPAPNYVVDDYTDDVYVGDHQVVSQYDNIESQGYVVQPELQPTYMPQVYEPQGYVAQPEQQPTYVPQGYVQNDVVYDDVRTETYQEPSPNTQKHISIHDGGQYSVSYEETTY